MITSEPMQMTSEARAQALLQHMEALAAGVPGVTVPPNIFRDMQGELLAYDEDPARLVVRFPVLERYQNPLGMMQGGMLVAAVDNTIGPLSYLVAPPSTTTQLSTTFVRPVTPQDATIEVEARLLERTRTYLHFSATVRNPAGKVVAPGHCHLPDPRLVFRSVARPVPMPLLYLPPTPRALLRRRTVLTALFGLLALAYAVVQPIFEVSDEVRHYPVADFIARTGQLPVQDPNRPNAWDWQAAQPPLYYVLAALIIAPFERSDLSRALEPNPHTQSGVGLATHNQNLVLPGWGAERFPWRGTPLHLRLVRGLSVLLGTWGNLDDLSGGASGCSSAPRRGPTGDLPERL
ncbi:MAG: PaaI family thioesterase [Anaerolineae bacterium]|nr:PaaI family thioesterase [Anaerolineae bacterium]